MNDHPILEYIDREPDLYEKITAEFPYFIAHEYRRFYELLDNGQYFGAYFEMKDVLEILLKFPALLATAYIENTQDNVPEKKSCLRNLIQKQMSLGEWEKYTRNVMNSVKEDKKIQPLYLTLKSILKIYSKEKVINWRNNQIGHGAVAGNIMQCAQDFRKYSGAVNRHLRETGSFYTDLKIYLNENCLKGTSLPELKTGQKPAGQIFSIVESMELRACLGDISFSLQPYIFLKGQYIYFFDSMNSWRLVVDALDYVNGRKIVLQSEFFLRKYHELVDGSLQTEDKSVGDVMASGDNNYLNRLNEAEDFVPMDNLHQWVLDCLEQHEKGVFLLGMERGMGKTAFVSSLDPLIQGDDGDEDLMDAVIRCYYCSRLEFRSTNDFVGACNTGMFRKNRDADLNLESSERELKTLTLDCMDPAGQMCDYLKDYRNIYEALRYKDKLILMIDGLDEITPDRLLETGNTIFDYIPGEDRLPENVYIFLTCRTGQEEPLTPFVQERLKGLSITESCMVRREAGEHRENLKRYLRKNMDIVMASNEAVMGHILEKTQGSFVKLKLLVSLLHQGIKLEDLLEMNPESMLTLFLEKQKNNYGDKMFGMALDFLTLVVNAYEPLSLSQIAFLMNFREMPVEIIKIVHDMECLLDLKRTENGTRIRLANEAFREVLQKVLQPLMRKQLSQWIEMILIQGRQELNITESTDLYNHEGAMYLYGNILGYVEQWASEEQKARVYTKEFAEAIYRFEAKVDGKNHGYRGVLLDIGMSSAAGEILGRLHEQGQLVDQLIWAYTFNNKGYHRGITLSDGPGAEMDFERAYGIAFAIPERNEKILSAMGTFANNMAALKNKLHRSFEETEAWSLRSMEARKELMDMDFASGAENYMQSALNYVGLLCSYEKTEQLREVYEEMQSICGRIRQEYPESEGMLRPRGNRVNFGYVFQLASARMKYGQCLAGEPDQCGKAEELYLESIKDFEYLLKLTGGKQMAAHESLYKAWFFLGNIYLKTGDRKKSEECWQKSQSYVRQLKDSGKLYQNATLEEMKKVMPELRKICIKAD